MRGERRYEDMMCSDFQLWGVDKLEPGAVTVVGQIVCTDGGRWPVQREFNRRMKKRFQEQGIEIFNPLRRFVMESGAAKSAPEDEHKPSPPERDGQQAVA